MNEKKLDKAMFAAGCFWGVQYYFDMVPGVVKTTVGYSGGQYKNPTYWDLHEKDTGHAEVTLIEFDPKIVSYEKLVGHFFRIHNPTLKNAADGINIGDSYRSALFYFNDDQKKIAEKVTKEIQKMYDKPIVTEFSEASTFYPAEDYHQKYTERTGRGMCHVAYDPTK
jgi:methionine-S-sulfoxide reductase